MIEQCYSNPGTGYVEYFENVQSFDLLGISSSHKTLFNFQFPSKDDGMMTPILDPMKDDHVSDPTTYERRTGESFRV